MQSLSHHLCLASFHFRSPFFINNNNNNNNNNKEGKPGLLEPCSKKSPCTGIKMEDMRLTFKNQQSGDSSNNNDRTTSGFIRPSNSL